MTTPYDYRVESIPTEYGVLYVGGVLYVHMYSVECIRISVPPDPTSRDHPHHPRPKTQDRRPEVSSYVGSYGVKQAKYRTDRAGHPCTVGLTVVHTTMYVRSSIMYHDEAAFLPTSPRRPIGPCSSSPHATPCSHALPATVCQSSVSTVCHPARNFHPST